MDIMYKKNYFFCVLFFRFCRGCKVECNVEDFNFGGLFFVIDWEFIVLYLRY